MIGLSDRVTLITVTDRAVSIFRRRRYSWRPIPLKGHGKVFCWFLPLLLLGCSLSAPPDDESGHHHAHHAHREDADSVILFIGDGMGVVHRKAAQWVSVGARGTLTMDSLLHHGELKTRSANDEVTDSAAAATAMAAGTKTNNGVLGLDADLQRLTSILEIAQDRGKAVGLVTTTQITHATPAAFAVHIDDRHKANAIAEQLLAAGIDVLLGGGEDHFLPPSTPGCFPGPGRRDDSRSLIDEAVADGYTYVCDEAGLASIDSAQTGRVLGLFADGGLMRPFSPSLALMTKKAIDVLSQNDAGFFLVVESGQIDWASHDNDAHGVIADVIALDQAVKAAVEYAEGNEGTLIIVTADHETGGMSVSRAEADEADEADGRFVVKDTGEAFYINWSTTGHTAKNVPVTATGPRASMLQGIHDNTTVFDVMHSAITPKTGHAH